MRQENHSRWRKFVSGFNRVAFAIFFPKWIRRNIA
jgi:hypothetical protein